MALQLVTLCENREVDINHLDHDVEKLPQDDRIRFHSISRDFEEMMIDNSYLDGVRGMRTNAGEPCMFGPSMTHCTYQTKRLHSLMNLDDMPMPDIVQTFSPWKIRPRKSE